MNPKSKRFKFLSFFLLLSIIIFILIIRINQNELQLNHKEIKILKKEFRTIRIQNRKDIINIQNEVIRKIRHNFIGENKIEISKIISNHAGFCYDRSFLLQKIMILNNIPIRPVFIYYSSSGTTTIFDFFNSKTLSHNVFEFYYSGKWYVMRTNTPMYSFQSLDNYIRHSKIIPCHSKYVRYLNNRNSKFISPSFVPDIYWY